MARDFPVNSTSVETAAIKRVVRVMQRTPASEVIGYGGVFNCRVIAGTNSYSQHAWGNAVDLFPRDPSATHTPVDQELDRIFHAAIRQAENKTKYNHFRRMPASEIIHHNARLIWTPDAGIHAYGGTTGAHIHVSGAPLKHGTPPCAR
jgi:hypothetical protein